MTLWKFFLFDFDWDSGITKLLFFKKSYFENKLFQILHDTTMTGTALLLLMLRVGFGIPVINFSPFSSESMNFRSNEPNFRFR